MSKKTQKPKSPTRVRDLPVRLYRSQCDTCQHLYVSSYGGPIFCNLPRTSGLLVGLAIARFGLVWYTERKCSDYSKRTEPQPPEMQPSDEGDRHD